MGTDFKKVNDYVLPVEQVEPIHPLSGNSEVRIQDRWDTLRQALRLPHPQSQHVFHLGQNILLQVGHLTVLPPLT